MTDFRVNFSVSESFGQKTHSDHPQARQSFLLDLTSRSGRRELQRWGQLCVDDETHGSTYDEHGVISLGSGVFETGRDVFRFEIGIVRVNFRIGNTCGQQIELVFHSNSYASDAGAAAALIWIEGDSTAHRFEVAGEVVPVMKLIFLI